MKPLHLSDKKDELKQIWGILSQNFINDLICVKF